MSEEKEDIELDWISFHTGDELWLGTIEDFEAYWTSQNYQLNEKNRKICFRIAELVVESVIRGDLQRKGKGHIKNRICRLIDKALRRHSFQETDIDVYTANIGELTIKYYDVIIRYLKSRKGKMIELKEVLDDKCTFCGKSLRRLLKTNRRRHINIHNDPSSRYFCSYECKYKWIMEKGKEKKIYD